MIPVASRQSCLRWVPSAGGGGGIFSNTVQYVQYIRYKACCVCRGGGGYVQYIRYKPAMYIHVGGDEAKWVIPKNS